LASNPADGSIRLRHGYDCYPQKKKKKIVNPDDTGSLHKAPFYHTKNEKGMENYEENHEQQSD
jgi:hypothetical protein